MTGYVLVLSCCLSNAMHGQNPNINRGRYVPASVCRGKATRARVAAAAALRATRSLQPALRAGTASINLFVCVCVCVPSHFLSTRLQVRPINGLLQSIA